MKTYRRRAWIFGILTLLIMGFIFSQSFQPAAESDEESLSLVQMVIRFLDPNGRFTESQWNGFIRKAAHFAEFAALGLCVAGMTAAMGELHRCRYRSLPLLICLLTAVCDETIQTFIPGRAGMPADVMLDFVGTAFGVAVCLGLFFRTRRRKY